MRLYHHIRYGLQMFYLNAFDMSYGIRNPTRILNTTSLQTDRIIAVFITVVYRYLTALLKATFTVISDSMLCFILIFPLVLLRIFICMI